MKKSIRKTLFCPAVLVILILPLIGNTVCASENTYYFNGYINSEEWRWETNPGNMTDGNTGTFASTTDSNDVQWLNSNTCDGTETGTITKVEIRVFGYWSGADRDIILQPVFGGSLDGDEHSFDAPKDEGVWSSWFNITDDTNSHSYWTWRHVEDLDCKVKVGAGSIGFTLYASKVEIKVTYDL